MNKHYFHSSIQEIKHSSIIFKHWAFLSLLLRLGVAFKSRIQPLKRIPLVTYNSTYRFKQLFQHFNCILSWGEFHSNHLLSLLASTFHHLVNSKTDVWPKGKPPIPITFPLFSVCRLLVHNCIYRFRLHSQRRKNPFRHTVCLEDTVCTFNTV